MMLVLRLTIGATFCLAAVAVRAEVRDSARILPELPAHTYSIVARDAETGEFGVAVQTHWFAVGQRVAWAEAGVGAVAAQSFTDPSHGFLGLELMRAGKGASEVLEALVAIDSERLMAALRAAQDEGGDIRGKQSAREAFQAVRELVPDDPALLERILASRE